MKKENSRSVTLTRDVMFELIVPIISWAFLMMCFFGILAYILSFSYSWDVHELTQIAGFIVVFMILRQLTGIRITKYLKSDWTRKLIYTEERK